MELGAGLQPGFRYHIALLYFSILWMLKYSLAGQLARFEHHTVEVYPWPIVMAMVMIMVMVALAQIPISTFSHIWVLVRQYGIMFVIIVIIIIIIII